MWKYNDYNELYHYGVKGMKWGKHKSFKDYITRFRPGNFDPKYRNGADAYAKDGYLADPNKKAGTRDEKYFEKTDYSNGDQKYTRYDDVMNVVDQRVIPHGEKNSVELKKRNSRKKRKVSSQEAQSRTQKALKKVGRTKMQTK